jgi:hypothetical protein
MGTDNFNTPKTNRTTDEWLTPLWVIRRLGDFDLDPCAPTVRPWDMAQKHYTLADGDGLTLPWHGRVWLNPPYGRETFKWMAKLAEHRSGVGLIFARTDTRGFHEQIFKRAHSLFFFEGRLKFCDVAGVEGDAPNAGSLLVSYSETDSQAISSGMFRGKQVFL